jgi:hypothetical protein
LRNHVDGPTEPSDEEEEIGVIESKASKGAIKKIRVLNTRVSRANLGDSRAAGAAAPVILEPPESHALLAHDTDPFFATGNTTIYDDFESNPDTAQLLLAHNTNLGSFPAIQLLRDATASIRSDAPAFDKIIDDCKAAVNGLTGEIIAAREKQITEFYDARDPRAALVGCVTCGVRRFHTEEAPYSRCALEALAIFRYDTILASSGNGDPEKATDPAKFTMNQIERIEHARAFVDEKSGLTCDLMLDFYEHLDVGQLPGAKIVEQRTYYSGTGCRAIAWYSAAASIAPRRLLCSCQCRCHVVDLHNIGVWLMGGHMPMTKQSARHCCQWAPCLLNQIYEIHY